MKAFRFLRRPGILPSASSSAAAPTRSRHALLRCCTASTSAGKSAGSDSKPKLKRKMTIESPKKEKPSKISAASASAGANASFNLPNFADIQKALQEGPQGLGKLAEQIDPSKIQEMLEKSGAPPIDPSKIVSQLTDGAGALTSFLDKVPVPEDVSVSGVLRHNKDSIRNFFTDRDIQHMLGGEHTSEQLHAAVMAGHNIVQKSIN